MENNQDGIVMPEFPGTPSKEEQKVNLINEISSIAAKMELLWQYHPTNPKAGNIIEEYKTLQEWMNASQEAYQNLVK